MNKAALDQWLTPKGLLLTSVAVAVVTIALKTLAWWLTDSVGLLSDAMESVVNLASAIFGLMMVTVAARPADEDHPYGHHKAEYFSSGFEGILIVVAALGIVWAASHRIFDPQPIEQVGLGLALSVVSSALNGVLAWVMFRASKTHRSVALEADARHLVNMSLMGAAMASILFDIERPTVGLLNVGTEDVKGLDEIKLAGTILKENAIPTLEYAGFVEGDDIGQGTVDVVVTEGFTGNIALKTAEGTARQIASYLKQAMSSSLMSKIGYLFARSAFAALKDRMDPRKVNGGVFLGLDGVVIKSHGGTDATGFAAAIDVGYDMVKYRLLDRIRSAVGDEIKISELSVKSDDRGVSEEGI